MSDDATESTETTTDPGAPRPAAGDLPARAEAAGEPTPEADTPVAEAGEVEPEADTPVAEAAGEVAPEADTPVAEAGEVEPEADTPVAEAGAEGAEPTVAEVPVVDAAVADVAGEAVPPAGEAAVPERPATVVRSIEPARAPQTIGGVLTIRGEHFGDKPSVRLGAVDLEPVEVSDDTLVVAAPAAERAGHVDVVVDAGDGAAAGLLVRGLFWEAPPRLRDVRPTSLPAAGGARLVLLGEDLPEGGRVTVGGVEVEAVRVDAETIRAISPAHPVGPGDVRLLAPDGQVTTLAEAVRFEDGPVVEWLVPSEGPPEGGTAVEVGGKNFAEGCVIAFFDRAPAVERVDATRLRFVTPPGEMDATGTLRVTNPDGLGTVMLEAFSYRRAAPPVVQAVSPGSAWITGGLRLTLTGSGFRPDSRVILGEVGADTTFKSETTLEVVVPPAEAAGPTEIRVVNPDGQQVVASGQFRYEPPPMPAKLLSVHPAKLFLSGGTIEMRGQGFDEHTRVRVAEVSSTVRLVDPERIEVFVAPRQEPGKVAVEIMNGSNVLVRFEDAFEYAAKPSASVLGIEPKQGPVTGGTRVTFDGSGFERTSQVFFGREQAKPVSYRDPQRLEAVAPPAKTAGVVDVTVTTPETVPVVLKNAFRYEPLPAPVVQSVSPNRGGTKGGTELGISGKNFVRESVVLVGGAPATKVKLVDASTLECRTPPGKNGQMVDVVVKNPGGKEAVARRAFQYDERYD